jgi:hypothetical protein
MTDRAVARELAHPSRIRDGLPRPRCAVANVTRQAPVPLLSLATLFVVICAILAVGLALKYRKGRLTARL